MQRPYVRGAVALAAIISASLCAVWAAQPGHTLTRDKAIISTQVRMVEGRPYVPLADFARAFNLSWTKVPSGYALGTEKPAVKVPEAPAVMSAGRMGETLSTGEWQLLPLALEEFAEYIPRYSSDRYPVQPSGTGDRLIAVRCRVRNLQKERRELAFDERAFGGNTVLLDDQEHAYAPYKYDVHADENSSSTAHVMPGLVVDFAVIFSVPAGTRPQAMVYTLGNRDQRNTPGAAADVRVLFAQK